MVKYIKVRNVVVKEKLGIYWITEGAMKKILSRLSQKSNEKLFYSVLLELFRNEELAIENFTLCLGEEKDEVRRRGPGVPEALKRVLSLGQERMEKGEGSEPEGS